MADETYSPKYGVSVDEVPLTDPSRLEDQPEVKLDAIEDAETQLEWDVNSGERIDSAESIHAKAVRAYATYVLKTPSASPGSRRSGDAADDGQRRLQVAKEYKAMYDDVVETLLEVDKNEDADPGTETYAVPFQFESY